jgi:hypothetical protein
MKLGIYLNSQHPASDDPARRLAETLERVRLIRSLGLVRILGSVNRIEQVSGRFSKVDILAPVVLVTAVVIRFIKTRADIGGWNKPPAG